MGPDLDKAIDEIRLQMRRLEAIQQNSPNMECLTERAVLLSLCLWAWTTAFCQSSLGQSGTLVVLSAPPAIKLANRCGTAIGMFAGCLVLISRSPKSRFRQSAR